MQPLLLFDALALLLKELFLHGAFLLDQIGAAGARIMLAAGIDKTGGAADKNDAESGRVRQPAGDRVGVETGL